MGEIADDHDGYIHDELERMECDPDYYGGGYGGYGRGYMPPLPVETRSCPQCGTKGLKWSGFGIGRYLYKPGLGRHTCRMEDLAEDFDDVS